VRFWDSSALVPLLLEQEESAGLRALSETDPAIAAWWGTSLECASAAARLRREGELTARQEDQVLQLLAQLKDAWSEVQPSEEVRSVAQRLLRVHALRAGDALHLAAALAWAGSPTGAELVTLDERLALAARLEGFVVLPA
jgi:uncharacterized protein